MDQPIDCICFSLRRAARLASRSYDAALAPVGLRNTQFSLLCVIEARGPLPLTELADLAVMERTTLTRNLRLLEKQKLVRSSPGEDKRQRVIQLTSQGRKTIQAALPAWRAAQKGLSGQLGKTRKQRLMDDLRFVVKVTR